MAGTRGLNFSLFMAWAMSSLVYSGGRSSASFTGRWGATGVSERSRPSWMRALRAASTRSAPQGSAPLVWPAARQR